MEEAPLRKMSVTWKEADGALRVSYALPGIHGPIALNERIGSTFTVRFTGQRSCTRCGRQVRKLFADGLCYPCFRDAPEASPCIIRPELCEAHLGRGRDVQWELDHHMQEHVVYLAYTGGVKVGVTRATQVPVRWIDQGATAAVPIARVPYRQLAGVIEVDLKHHFADRTNWRRMLLLHDSSAGKEAVLQARATVGGSLSSALQKYGLADGPMTRLSFPLQQPPPKLVSVKLDKLPEITGTLQGIKGQYLIWADGRVLNVRGHGGYHVEVDPL